MKFFIYLLMVLTVLCSSSLYSQEDITESILGYYPLDGDALDYSGNCHHGKVFGATVDDGFDGKAKTSLKFDGIKDYIEIPPFKNFSYGVGGDYSFSLWVKIDPQTDKDTSDNDILSIWVKDDSSMEHEKNGYPFTLRVQNQNNHKFSRVYAAQFGGYRQGCIGSTTIHGRIRQNSNKFHHIVFTATNNTLTLYIDGQLVKKKRSDVFCKIDYGAPLRLGKRGGKSFQNHFRGTIDELAIFSKALSENEVHSLFQGEFVLSKKYNNNVERMLLVKSDTLYFENDVFQLTGGQRMRLQDFHTYLELSEDYNLLIEGHTNTLPSAEFCDALSLKRADVVGDYLQDLGLSCLQVRTKGMGKRFPLTESKDPVLRKRNQRVEVKLLKKNRA